ncbi:thioredoxin family protein [Patescibacteria group bacterium]
MVLTRSTMLSLGTKSPDFSLLDVVTNKKVNLSDFKGKSALLVMFICSHCPYVKHVEEELVKIGEDYKDKDLGIVAISSNDPDYDWEDKPEGLKKQAESAGFTFPYLIDEDQSVAKTYTAACTPDFFLFDKENKLAYRGQLDDSRPENGMPVTGKDLRNAIDSVLSGGEVDSDQKPSAGCNIKWKQGNAPSYFA